MKQEKKVIITVLLFIALVAQAFIIPFAIAEAQVELPTSGSTIGEVSAKPVVFEEFSSFIRLNFSMFSVDFYKGSAGYNIIYDSNGDVTVYNERHVLEYWTKSQWKQRGVPTSLSIR